jgi:hypothetical protein
VLGDPRLLDEVPPQVMLPGADCHHALLVPAHASVVVVVVEHDGGQADGDFVPVRQALDEGAQLFDGDQMARAFSGSSPVQLDLGWRQGAIVARIQAPQVLLGDAAVADAQRCAAMSRRHIWRLSLSWSSRRNPADPGMQGA